MKVLVTGATGFIGTYVINELLKQDVEIIATSTSKEKAKQKTWFSHVTYVEHDINNVFEDLFKIFHQPESIIHLAWRGLPNYKDLFHVEEEMMAQYFFIKKLVEQGVRNINITGTCFEYGLQEGCLFEDKNLANPVNCYAIAKDNLRKLLILLKDKQYFSLKWMRLFYIYGAGQNANSLLSQLQLALDRENTSFNMSGGEQIRDYLPVEELAKYIVACSLQTTINGAINISSNNPIKVVDLVKAYLSKRNKSISLNLGFYPYPEYEPFAFWGDNNKLKQVIK